MTIRLLLAQVPRDSQKNQKQEAGVCWQIFQYTLIGNIKRETQMQLNYCPIDIKYKHLSWAYSWGNFLLSNAWLRIFWLICINHRGYLQSSMDVNL